MSSLKLGLSGQATARAVVIAMTVGAGLGAMWLSLLDHRFALGWGAFPPNAFTLPGHLMISGLAAGGLTLGVILLRQPNGAKLSWDDWGLHEWDGEGVRVALPFSKLRMGSLLTVMRRKHSFRPGVPIGSFITLSDGGDRRIYVTVGTQLAWLADRLTSVDTLDPLLKVIGEAEVGAPDLGRDKENALAAWWVLGLVGYIAAALALAGLVQPHSVSFPAATVLEGAAAFMLLRALQPLFRWLKLGREDARFAKAAGVTLNGHEGTMVNATAADGKALRFDVGALNHPDGAVQTRRGPAFVVLGEGGVPVALETAGVRAARGHRKRALLLEAGLRALAAALLVVPVI